MNFFKVGNTYLALGGKLLSPLVENIPSEPEEPVQPPGEMPITNISGWWDASVLTPNISAYSIADKSSANKLAVSGGTPVKAVARMAGILNGLYADKFPSGYSVLHPVIDDYHLLASNIAVGAGQTFTVVLVWSRANQRQPQQGALSTESVNLLTLSGIPIVRLTGNGDGNDTLTLFPTLSPVNAGTLTLRHTRSMRVVFNGSTVDLWLDGTKIISASANQITLASSVNVEFLDGSQLIFHEAAAWAKTLDVSEQTVLTSYLSRWPLGPRRAVDGVAIGQSNLQLLLSNYVLWPQINAAVAYLTGCISANMLWSDGTYGTLGGQTTFSGQGLYNGTPYMFLDNSGGGNPSTWPLGTNGERFVEALNSMSADKLDNFRYIAWYWSENDSNMLTYANKATYLAAMKRAFELIRTGINRTAAQLPILVINALPFDTAQGAQTHREVMADLVADATQNCSFMLANAQDAIGQGDGWDASTGQESGGGNFAHRDDVGASLFLRRWAAPIARAAIAANTVAGTPDVTTVINPAIPITNGPKISNVQYEGGTSLLVTFTHDGGNDLIVPLRAAIGAGWTLMDGLSSSASGNPGAPGALITATACVKVSATQVRITLASIPAFPTKAKLYYPYGSGLNSSGYSVIGRGNAITDNFSSVVLPSGWRIGQDLGSNAQPNNPVQATTYGVGVN